MDAARDPRWRRKGSTRSQGPLAAARRGQVPARALGSRARRCRARALSSAARPDSLRHSRRSFLGARRARELSRMLTVPALIVQGRHDTPFRPRPGARRLPGRSPRAEAARSPPTSDLARREPDFLAAPLPRRGAPLARPVREGRAERHRRGTPSVSARARPVGRSADGVPRACRRRGPASVALPDRTTLRPGRPRRQPRRASHGWPARDVRGADGGRALQRRPRDWDRLDTSRLTLAGSTVPGRREAANPDLTHRGERRRHDPALVRERPPLPRGGRLVRTVGATSTFAISATYRAGVGRARGSRSGG